MSRHASTDDLASYAEGLLRHRRAAKIASHLAGCAQCSGVIQEIRQVSVTLASVTFSAMPTELSARIQLAIASESTVRVTSEPAGEASRRDLPVPGQRSPARRGLRIPRFSSPLTASIAAVGAAVILAGGGYEIATNLSSGGTTAAGSSSSARHVPAASISGAASNAGRAPSASAPNATPANSVRYGPEITYQHGGQNQTIDTVETGTNFSSGASFPTQAVATLDQVRQSNLKYAGKALSKPGAYAGSEAHINAKQLQGCIGKVAAGRDVQLVDIAQYRGKPATIVIVGGQDSSPATVYAVGGSCSASNADVLAHQNLPLPPS
jgi:hypothetical protein